MQSHAAEVSLARKRGRGYSGFQVTRMVEGGQTNKIQQNYLDQKVTPKTPMPKFRAIKLISRKHYMI